MEFFEPDDEMREPMRLNTAIGDAVAKCSAILDGLTNAERGRALKAIAGLYDRKVVFAAPTLNVETVKRYGKTRGQPGPCGARQKSSTSPITKIRQEIGDLNKRISTRSKELGTRLDDRDPLIEDRNRLFRRLKEAKNEITHGPGPSGQVYESTA